MTEYYTMDSFGSLLPENWEEICDFLNTEIEKRISEDMTDVEIRDADEALWEAYCAGDLPDAPKAQL